MQRQISRAASRQGQEWGANDYAPASCSSGFLPQIRLYWPKTSYTQRSRFWVFLGHFSSVGPST